MVSNVRMAQIHLRCTEIFAIEDNKTLTFAGINMLFTGDLLQVI